MLRYVGLVVALVLLLAGWLAVGPWIFAVLLVALLVPATRRRMRPNRWALGGVVAAVAVAVGVVALLPDGRLPIPPGGGQLVTPSYDGHAAKAQPIVLSVPQHPALAANGSSSMHADAWATDSYQGPGPLGKDPEVTTSWYGLEECATLALDPIGRLVALCGNRSGPVLHVLDPETMRPIETFDLPDREDSDKRPWEDLCGGAYFYLDARARAVVATTDRRVLTVDTDGLEQVDEVDLGDVVPDDDCLVALLPDWDGNTWYVTQDGRVGVAGGTGVPAPLDLDGEIANSIAADDTGVYLVTTEAFYKVELDPQRRPAVVWETAYDNGEEKKPGQLSAGSGTTPTVLPSGLVAITDNAEPQMHVQFYDVTDGSLVCEAAVFGKDESASDNSLVAVGDASVVVENNYGYGGAVEHDARPRHRRRAGPRGCEPGHRRVHGRVALRRGRAHLGREGLPGHRARLRVHHSTQLVGRERVVPHRSRRPHRRDHLLGPHRHRHPVQQPLLRGNARRRRVGVRRHAGRDGAGPRPPVTVRARERSGRTARRPRARGAPRSARCRAPRRWSRPGPRVRRTRPGGRAPSCAP